MEIGYQFKNPWLNFPSLILNKFQLIHGHWLGKGACHVWYGFKAERKNETYQEKLVNTVFSWVENWGFQILNTFTNRLHSTWSNKMGGKFNCSLLCSWQSEQISKVKLTWNDNWVWNYGLKTNFSPFIDPPKAKPHQLWQRKNLLKCKLTYGREDENWQGNLRRQLSKGFSTFTNFC